MIERFRRKAKRKESYLHKNFEFLLKKFRTDIKSLSFETGIPTTTLSRLKQEGSNPTVSSLEPLVDFFRIDIDSLLYEDLSTEAYNLKSKSDEVKHIPVIDFSDIAKWPCNFEEKAFVGSLANASKETFGVRVEMDSLMPIFQKNSLVVIDPELDPKDSDYVFCI